MLKLAATASLLFLLVVVVTLIATTPDPGLLPHVAWAWLQ